MCIRVNKDMINKETYLSSINAGFKALGSICMCVVMGEKREHAKCKMCILN